MSKYFILFCAQFVHNLFTICSHFVHRGTFRALSRHFQGAKSGRCMCMYVCLMFVWCLFDVSLICLCYAFDVCLMCFCSLFRLWAVKMGVPLQLSTEGEKCEQRGRKGVNLRYFGVIWCLMLVILRCFCVHRWQIVCVMW